jgi:phosphatidylserine decarboxylase
MLAKGSLPWIFVAIIIAIISASVAYLTDFLLFNILAIFSGAGVLGLLWFYRDPERVIELQGDAIIAPADGKIIDIRGRKVCIFMNVQNVHVNRVPIAGKIKKIEYRKGGYLPAFYKDSRRNERSRIILETKYGDVEVTQIAGALVRRIVLYFEKGDVLSQGERFGMIRFGSRVDVTVPDSFQLLCKKGDKVKAGKSLIAKIID